MSSRDPRSVDEIRRALMAARGVELRKMAADFADDPRAGVAEALRVAMNHETARAAERRRLGRLYRLEGQLRESGCTVVAGVDEVGRGAIAGPLSAGACVLPRSPRIEGVDDSKRLSPQRRSELSVVIKSVAVCWSVAHISAEEIDALGVTTALRRVMGRALAGLSLEPDHVVIDGRPMGIAAAETAVIKGDAKVAAIAAASILAKVERDSLMVSLADNYPHYGFDVNKGYGTIEHLQAVAAHGMSPYHRRTFCPGGGTETLF
jgi:ribonuclease HII